MVAVEIYALNNECAPNNEVVRISSYHSVIHGKCNSTSVNARKHHSTWRYKKPSTVRKELYVVTTLYKCVISGKTMCLIDEYMLSSEVCLTSRLYSIYLVKLRILNSYG